MSPIHGILNKYRAEIVLAGEQIAREVVEAVSLHADVRTREQDRSAEVIRCIRRNAAGSQMSAVLWISGIAPRDNMVVRVVLQRR